MGVLCDYFIAAPTELDGVTEGALPEGWPRLDAKGFSVVPLDALGARLGARATEAGPPVLHGDDYAWFVSPLTADMVTALAQLSDEEVASHAAALAPIPELGWKPAEAERVISGLAHLARGAGDRRMYLWMST